MSSPLSSPSSGSSSGSLHTPPSSSIFDFSFGDVKVFVSSSAQTSLHSSSNNGRSSPRVVPQSSQHSRSENAALAEDTSPAKQPSNPQSPDAAGLPLPRSRTSSPGPFKFGEGSAASFTFNNDHDPDKPLPSVERSVPVNEPTSSNTVVHTPPRNSDRGPSDSEIRGLDNSLQALRLETPAKAKSSTSSSPANGRAHARGESHSSSQADLRSLSAHSTPTPSVRITPVSLAHDRGQNQAEDLLNDLDVLRIQSPSVRVTPVPPASEHHLNQPEKSDDLSDGLDALRIKSPSNGRPNSSRGLQSGAGTPSRRRSGSSVGRECHRVEDEEPPSAFFRVREVEKVLAQGRSMTQNLTSILASSQLHRESDSSINKLHEEATRLSRFEPPCTRIVGLVGDSGVGKSSLINSLLDRKDLARSSNSGSACTCVATEYHYHEREDYAIRAEYFTLQELRVQYEEMLRFYQENEDPPSGTTREDLEDLRLRAKLAHETFKASFGEMLQQRPGLLTSPISRAVPEMLRWASLLLPKEFASHPIQREETFSDVTSCSSRIRELTSEIEPDDLRKMNRTSPWPFVKKLKVYLRAYILSKGLVIADLPGLRDANSARQNIAERYVLHCHQVLAVARIERAISDQSVKDVLQLARRAKLSNVHIVCTNSEAIRVKEALDTYPAERAAIAAMQNRLKAAKDKFDELIEIIEDYDENAADLTPTEIQEYGELQRERWDAWTTKENERFNLSQHIVTIRNADVTRRIQAEYRDHPVAESLKVFCVSNKEYWAHRLESAAASRRHLELSGILELRKHCIGIIAESHVRAINHFVKHEIPTLLGSATLWVEAGSGNASAEKKQEILDTVNAVQVKLHDLTSPISQINGISRNLRNDFNRQVRQHMEAKVIRWTRSSRLKSSEWDCLHHSTFSAFCRNYGEHKTDKAGYHCWNEEATSLMAHDTVKLWSNFINEVNSRVAVIEEWIKITIGDVAALAFRAAQSTNAANSALGVLTKTLHSRGDLLMYYIEDAIEDFRNELSALRTSALAPIRTAFIGRVMENSYRAANMEYGTGSDRRRKDHVLGRFRSESLFNAHRRMFRDGFKDLASKIETDIQAAVAEQTASIEWDLQLLKDENVILESERNPQFRKSLAEEIERARAELEHLSSLLDVRDI